jgi:hypothetical protein
MPLRRPGPGACLPIQKLIEVLVLARRVPLRRSAPPRRKAPIRPGKPPDRRVPIRKARGRPRRGPERSADYLAWIRTLGCVVCSRVSTGQIVIEAAHTNALGRRGLSQKSSDYSAIPLCPSHHRENADSYHRLGEQRFACEHQINLRGLVDGLNRLFERYGSTDERISKPKSHRSLGEGVG